MPKKHKKESDDDDFVVEVITAARVVEGSEDDSPGWEYFVHWYGYPESEWTWEPHENVASCERLMSSFWSEIGEDNGDYLPGYQVDASKEWIAREKKFFRDQLARDQKKKAARAKQQTSKVKRSSTHTASPSRASSTSSTAPRKISKSSKLKALESSEEESDVALVHKASVRKGKTRIVESESDEDTEVAKGVAGAKRKKSASRTSPGESGSKRRKVDSTVSAKPRQARKALPNSLHEDFSDENDAHLSHRKPSLDKGRAKEERPLKAKTSLDSLFDGDRSDDSTPLATTSKAPARTAANKPARPELHKLITSMVAGSSSKQSQTPQSAIPPSMRQAHGSASSSPSTTHIGGSTLSTKHRLGQTVNTLSKPSDIKKPKSLPSFKKRVGATPTFPYQPSPTLPPPPPIIRNGNDRTTPEDNDIVMRDEIPVGNDDIHIEETQPSTTPTLEEKNASAWLESHMSNLPEPPSSNVNAGRTLTVKSALGMRIKKKWKWEGELCRMTEQGSESLGRVTISDNSEPKPGGPSLDKLIKEDLTRLEMGYLRPAHDLNLLLPPLKGVQQFAGMNFDNRDGKSVQILTQYMLRKNLFALAPIFTTESEEPYAFLAIYPSASIPLRTRMHQSAGPIQHKSEATFFVALLPWTFAPIQIESTITRLEGGLSVNTAQEWRREPHRIDMPRLQATIFRPSKDSRLLKEQPLRQAVLCRPDFTRAVHALRMPIFLLQSFVRARDVFVFNGDPASRCLETQLLSAILGRYKLLNIEKSLTAPRTMFIHRSALQTLPRLANFSSVRASKRSLQIFVYGTDLSIHPSQWAVKEVYPIGGVVTFTPDALVRNPVQCFELAGQIHKHPLWACYILPCVLGAVATVVSCGSDPSEVALQGDFILSRLVEYVQEGVIGLTSSPPDKFSQGFDEKFTRWQHIQRAPSTMSVQDLLKNSVSNLEAMYARLSVEQRQRRLIWDVCNELAKMQRQPIIMDSYRRFVVMVPEEDKPLAPVDHSLECITVNEFKFNDIPPSKDDVTRLHVPTDEFARMVVAE